MARLLKFLKINDFFPLQNTININTLITQHQKIAVINYDTQYCEFNSMSVALPCT